MSGQHKCYVGVCRVQVRTELLMCAEHWRIVPKRVRREVYIAWDKYNDAITAYPSVDSPERVDARARYMAAIKAARDAVELADGARAT